MKYDIAIIGGGPAGYTAAERAAANGLQTVLFEKKAIGGVCLNEGCIPTKTLLYSAKLWDNMKGAFRRKLLLWVRRTDVSSFRLPAKHMK